MKVESEGVGSGICFGLSWGFRTTAVPTSKRYGPQSESPGLLALTPYFLPRAAAILVHTNWEDMVFEGK